MPEQNLFIKLKRLFSSDVVVRNIGGKKLRIIDVDRLQSMGVRTNMFQDKYARINHPESYSYNMAISFQTNRLMLYTDYEVMDSDPILSSALDVYADECTTKNEYGDILKIESSDADVKDILHNLFYDVLNIDFNLWMWIRNFTKYGNQWGKLNISEKYGIVGIVPLSAYEVVREDGYDQKNPNAVRYKLQGAFSATAEFYNYEMADFRLMTDSNFLPYGKSAIESARKVWKQLTLMEDAMLIHRIMRAPEKRVFKIDTGGIDPNEIDQYMQAVMDKMKKTPYIDPATGDYNLKFNMMNMTEDFYLPTRGGDTGTSIDTIKGLEFSAIDDIEYLKHKMLAALHIPKAFLGYEESIGAKSTLAAEDVRFSRTIERMQRMVVSELVKIAVIHLYAQGITDERLVNFELSLTNPSTISEQEKLNLWKVKIDIANDILSAEHQILDSNWVYKNVFGFNDVEMDDSRKGVLNDKKRMYRYQQIAAEGNDPVKTGQSFGTAHDLALLNKTGTDSNVTDFGNSNFNTIKPTDPMQQGQEQHGGRPEEGSQYGQDSHVRGRDPIGGKSLANSLETDSDTKHNYKGGNPLHREEVEKKYHPHLSISEALKHIPPKFLKEKTKLMESIKTDDEIEENIEKPVAFLDETKVENEGE